MKKLRYMIEAAILWLAFFIFGLMKAETASDIGGWIGRTIGPRMGASKKAQTNLKNAMADLDDDARKKIIVDMWDNMGRVMAEYPHLRYIIENLVEIEGEEHVRALGEDRAAIIIGAHLSNWELLAFCFNYRLNLPVNSLYRKPNNPYTAKLLDKARNPEQRGAYIPKSSQGVREMVNTLKSGGRLGQLIDQKYNRGIAADFLGRPAMTSPAFAQLALKFSCPVLPMQTIRTGGCRFKFIFHPPIQTEGRTQEEIVLSAHKLLEEWIRERPGQWLWLHRRWDSKALKGPKA